MRYFTSEMPNNSSKRTKNSLKIIKNAPINK